MELKRAEMIALDLMTFYLGKGNFVFKFDNASRRFGLNRGKLISLSRKLVGLNNEDEVLDTILHEIAHALTPKEHHGANWRKTALSIGCNGERCYSSKTVIAPPKPFKGICPSCKKTVLAYRRKRLACRLCCIKFSQGKFDKGFMFEWSKNEEK